MTIASEGWYQPESPSAKRLSVVTLLVTALIICVAWSPANAKTKPKAPKPGPSIWFGVTGTGLGELTSSEIAASGAPTPEMFDDTSEVEVTGDTFDKSGDLWLTTIISNSILEYKKTQLANLNANPDTTAPAVTITSSAFVEPLGEVFDKSGNLWIVDAGRGVIEVTKKQLQAGSGDITPNVIINADALSTPAFALFDSSGDLWVSSEGSNQLVQFSKKQLKKSDTVTPAIVIASPSLSDPGQMQFDSKGNLWVTNSGNNTVVAFNKKQIKGNGSPTAAIVIGSTPVGAADSLDVPWGLQFDTKGNLWVYSYLSGALGEYAAGQIKVSGSPAPNIYLSNLPLYATQLTFGPASQ